MYTHDNSVNSNNNNLVNIDGVAALPYNKAGLSTGNLARVKDIGGVTFTAKRKKDKTIFYIGITIIIAIVLIKFFKP